MYLRSNPIREIVAGENSSPPPTRVNDAVAHIRMGSYYEMDHSVLPQRSPEQLKSIRVVMVGKITANDVSLRFPSMYSLKSHFNCSGSRRMNWTKAEKSDGILPLLDESHVMVSELAGELLYRRITHQEVSMKKNSWSFWVSAASAMNILSSEEMISQPAYNTRLSRAASPEGKCWSELRSRGMIKWGKRLRVRYQSRHVDNKKNKEEEEHSRVKEEMEEEEVCKEEMREAEDRNETEGSDHRVDKDVTDGRNNTLKRKLGESSTGRPAQIANKFPQKKQKKMVVYQKKSAKKFIDRWSVERYKRAERNMLKVMKEKNAMVGNTILRSELRSEARKLIGDTGLLDHLLKHMSGKVAPGGQDRFRRKHNADGAMEYWLENSDLIHIRKEAGVEDPYWTPPPGWKLGDNPSQDPVCAKDIREIREGLASLKREFEKLTSKKEEEDLAVVTTPNSCVTSQNLDSDSLIVPAKEIYATLVKKKYKIEEQLLIIAETMRKMEEDMGWLQRTVEDKCPRKPDSTVTPLLLEDSPSIKEADKENQVAKSPQKREQEKKDEHKGSPEEPVIGFRICRRVGSFSWPNLSDAATVLTQISTGEFASSPSYRSSSSSPCPVKPLAAKRPLALSLTFKTPASSEAPVNLFNC